MEETSIVERKKSEGKKKTKVMVVLLHHPANYRFYLLSTKDILGRSSNGVIKELPPPIMSGVKTDDKVHLAMSFIQIPDNPSQILMLGGFLPTNSVLIFDVHLRRYSRAPPLNSGKKSPKLFCVGSKIYALSKLIPSPIQLIPYPLFDKPPHLEFIDFSQPNPTWTPIHGLPPFTPEDIAHGLIFRVFAWAVVDTTLLISVDGQGTFGFHTTTCTWEHLDSKELPFLGFAHRCGDRWYALSHPSIISAFSFTLTPGHLSVTEFPIHRHPIVNSPLPPLHHPQTSFVPLTQNALIVLDAGLESPFTMTPLRWEGMHDKNAEPVPLFIQPSLCRVTESQDPPSLQLECFDFQSYSAGTAVFRDRNVSALFVV